MWERADLLKLGMWRVRVVMHCYFFFSSRRRHTRLQGDWSSDVCSSDLTRVKAQLSPGEPLDESIDSSRLGDVLDLEVAGDDRSVAQHTAQQSLLDLDRADPGQPHCGGTLAQRAVHDEELVRRQDDARLLPRPDCAQRDA